MGQSQEGFIDEDLKGIYTSLGGHVQEAEWMPFFLC